MGELNVAYVAGFWQGSGVASACGEWWRLLLVVVVVPAGCLCRVDIILLGPGNDTGAVPSNL